MCDGLYRRRRHLGVGNAIDRLDRYAREQVAVLGRQKLGRDADVLEICLDHLLEEAGGLRFAAEPSKARARTAARLGVWNPAGGGDPVWTTGDAVAITVIRICEADDRRFRYRLDQADAEDGRRKPHGHSDPCRDLLRLGAGDRLVLDLRATDPTEEIVALAADPLERVVEEAAPVAAMTGSARRVVEDRPQAGVRREAPLELGVAARERGQLGVRQPVDRPVEYISVGRGLGGEMVACPDCKGANSRYSDPYSDESRSTHANLWATGLLAHELTTAQ